MEGSEGEEEAGGQEGGLDRVTRPFLNYFLRRR